MRAKTGQQRFFIAVRINFFVVKIYFEALVNCGEMNRRIGTLNVWQFVAKPDDIRCSPGPGTFAGRSILFQFASSGSLYVHTGTLFLSSGESPTRYSQPPLRTSGVAVVGIHIAAANRHNSIVYNLFPFFTNSSSRWLACFYDKRNK